MLRAFLFVYDPLKFEVNKVSQVLRVRLRVAGTL